MIQPCSLVLDLLSDTPMDLRIKSNLVADLLTLTGTLLDVMDTGVKAPELALAWSHPETHPFPFYSHLVMAVVSTVSRPFAVTRVTDVSLCLIGTGVPFRDSCSGEIKRLRSQRSGTVPSRTVSQ